MRESDPSTASPATVAAIADALGRLAQLCEGGALIQPEGLTGEEAGRLAGVSKSMWYQLDAKGLCPAPVEIGTGACRRWLRREVLAWLAADCPARARWNTMRQSMLRRGA